MAAFEASPDGLPDPHSDSSSIELSCRPPPTALQKNPRSAPELQTLSQHDESPLHSLPSDDIVVIVEDSSQAAAETPPELVQEVVSLAEYDAKVWREYILSLFAVFRDNPSTACRCCCFWILCLPSSAPCFCIAAITFGLSIPPVVLNVRSAAWWVFVVFTWGLVLLCLVFGLYVCVNIVRQLPKSSSDDDEKKELSPALELLLQVPGMSEQGFAEFLEEKKRKKEEKKQRERQERLKRKEDMSLEERKNELKSRVTSLCRDTLCNSGLALCFPCVCVLWFLGLNVAAFIVLFSPSESPTSLLNVWQYVVPLIILLGVYFCCCFFCGFGLLLVLCLCCKGQAECLGCDAIRWANFLFCISGGCGACCLARLTPRCTAPRFALDFLEKNGLDRSWFTEIKCHCMRCSHLRLWREASKVLDSVATQGEMKYAQPRHWTRLALQPPRYYKKRLIDTWHVAYHGTSVASVKSILNSLVMLMPGDSQAGGGKLGVLPGHIQDEGHARRIFMSPSLVYVSCPSYCRPHDHDERRFVVALELWIKPQSYTIGPETIGAGESEIDPLFSNGELEWSTDQRGVIEVMAVLVKELH